MIRSELRNDLINEIAEYRDVISAYALADRILSIPHLKEALDFYEACQSAFEVNGEFRVTKESVRGKGGVSAS